MAIFHYLLWKYVLITNISKYLSLLQHIQHIPENHEIGYENSSERKPYNVIRVELPLIFTKYLPWTKKSVKHIICSFTKCFQLSYKGISIH